MEKLIGWLVGWLAGWLSVWLAGWLVGWYKNFSCHPAPDLACTAQLASKSWKKPEVARHPNQVWQNVIEAIEGCIRTPFFGVADESPMGI